MRADPVYLAKVDAYVDQALAGKPEDTKPFEVIQYLAAELREALAEIEASRRYLADHGFRF